MWKRMFPYSGGVQLAGTNCACWRFAPDAVMKLGVPHTAPARLACCMFAESKSVLVVLVPVRIATDRSAYWRFAPSKLALESVEPDRTAFWRLAPSRVA